MGEKATKALQYAEEQVGKPYVWGARGPNAFDCSGLTYEAYKHAGIDIGRTTYQQIKKGKAVSRKNLQPGDLVFTSPGHVQMYSGKGKIVEAARPGVGVRNSVLTSFYAGRRFDGGGGSEAGGSGDSTSAGGNPRKSPGSSGASSKSGPGRSVGGSSSKSGSQSGNSDWDHSSVVVVLVLAFLGFVGYRVIKGK